MCKFYPGSKTVATSTASEVYFYILKSVYDMKSRISINRFLLRHLQFIDGSTKLGHADLKTFKVSDKKNQEENKKKTLLNFKTPMEIVDSEKIKSMQKNVIVLKEKNVNLAESTIEYNGFNQKKVETLNPLNSENFLKINHDTNNEMLSEIKTNECSINESVTDASKICTKLDFNLNNLLPKNDEKTIDGKEKLSLHNQNYSIFGLYFIRI